MLEKLLEKMSSLVKTLRFFPGHLDSIDCTVSGWFHHNSFIVCRILVIIVIMRNYKGQTL